MVLPEMSLEEPGPGEGLPAELAAVVQAVREHVHGEGRHAHVVLEADGALARAPRVQGAVGLLVPRQVAARRVVFPAFRTRVFGPLAAAAVKRGRRRRR